MERAISPLRYLSFLLVFLIPLRNIVEKVPNFGLEGLNVTNILFGLIFIFMLIDRSRYNAIPNNKSRLKVPIILFISYTFLTIFWTDPRINNLSNMLKFWKDMALNMSLFFIAARAFRTRQDIIICLIIMAVANLYMDLYFWRWVRWMDFSAFADKMKSVNGTFGSIGGSNEWAAFFSTYSFVSLSIAETISDKKIKILACGLTALNMLVMLFTFSRGAYAAFTVGLVFYSLLTKRHWWLISVAVVALAYSLILPDAVVERIDMSFEVSSDNPKFLDKDVASRLEMWNYSWSKILESPFIGNGFMSFVFYIWKNPHNQHLSVLYQGGIIGYFCFVLIFWASVLDGKRLLSISAGHSMDKAIAIGVVSSAISLFSANIFGDRFTFLPVSGYFWVLNGLVVSLLVDRKMSLFSKPYMFKKVAVDLRSQKKAFRFKLGNKQC